MQRGERRAVLEVDADGRQHDARSRPARGVDDVAQVALEVGVDLGHGRVVGRDLLLQEHLHALPAAAAVVARLQRGTHQLADPRRAQQDAGTHQREAACRAG